MIRTTLSRRSFAALALAALSAPAWASEDDLAAKGYAVGDMALGDPNAPVTVIEYASLTCPHCATFHNDTWPTIRQNYVDTGKVRFIFRDVYFDQYGLWASMIARCGGEGPFFGYLTQLFGKQKEWARSDDIVGELQRIGRLGGLPAERMQACLTDEALLNRLVADYQANATADNVRSTPTFIINGETATGAMSAAAFSALIDKHL
ncbi:MAG: DsbA family protein [Rhodobacterales bacterium]|nr:DsbA family protein [Rhodobacterales bacterium]